MSASYAHGSSGAGVTAQQLIQNYSKFLPDLASLTSDQIGKFIGAIGKSGLDTAQTTGGQLANVVSNKVGELNPALQTSASGANNAVTQSANAGNAAENIVKSINLNGLSPGESNAIERSTNQSNSGTGNLGLLNPTNTISNAMNFGGAFNSKIPLAENAVNTLAGTSGASSNASNAASNSAGANTASMAGINSIINPSQLGTQAATGFAGQAGQMSAGTKSESNSTSMGGGVNCCFIFLEAYHGEMPWFVRKSRDKYYSKYPQIATGYVRMAKVLVPLMQKSNIVRGIVWNWMILPLTQYGAFTHRLTTQHRDKKSYRNFWFTVWNILGYV